MSDDPFAEPFDSERTVIRPRPGGSGGGARPAPRPADAPSPDSVPVPKTGANVLADAASPVIAAAIRIDSERGRGPDLERLRRAMVDAIHRFEKDALATGMDTTTLRAARYALCATVDDMVLSTPEGRASTWPQQSMTSIFHNEVVGGERFFDILEQMQNDLGRQMPVVELMYLCLSLGFVGRYRVRPRGVAELTDLREGVYNTIRQRLGEFERDLSPNWRGLDAGAKRLAWRIPGWAIGLGTLAIAALMYLGFTFLLAGASETAFAELYGLPPRGAVAIPRQPSVAAAIAAAALPPVAAPPGEFAERLRKFLEPEIKAGLVAVLDDAQTTTVRLTGAGMFPSGQAILNKSYNSLIGRIGDALNDEPGAVLVNGYTDDQPIRTARFPSNFELSQARAEAVTVQLKLRMKDASRLRAAGKGQTDPIESNATPTGRERNRRTEIVLIRTGNGG